VSVGVGVAVGAGEGVTVGLGSGVSSSVAVGAVAGAVVGTEAAVGVTIRVGEGRAVFKAACTVAGISSAGGVSAAPHPTDAAKITASTVSRNIPRL